MSSTRTKSYSVDEDIHLCRVYLDVSRNPTTGIGQTKEQFWERVKTEYHSTGLLSLSPRPKRSLQTRMTTMLSLVSKLRECVNQIENNNPSGASEQDVMYQAKMLFMQDAKYKKGFKFDHVWPILKGIEKVTNNNSQRIPEEGHNIKSNPSFSMENGSSSSPGMSSFGLNMNGEDGILNLTARPINMKKAKKNLRMDEELKKLMEQNAQLVQALQQASAEGNEVLRQKNEIEKQKIEVANMKEENKILLMDLSSISDLRVRAYFEKEKEKIMQKRTQKNQDEE